MGDTQLVDLGLEEAARAVAAREVSSVELTTACLDRMETVGARLNVAAFFDRDAALGAAREADADLAANGPRGPLHGVPLAHKDLYYRAGRESACGSALMAGFVPDYTATALTRLDQAGALDIARINMVEFALGTTGHNSFSGNVLNPWNPGYVSGGSSSGSGAAVAARTIYGSLGSDTGGSVRLPASACGLVGTKPSAGRVSRHGVMPLCSTFDTVGPLTRTVRDAALMLNVLAGHDPQDPTSLDLPVLDYLASIEDGIDGLRIAVPENFFFDPVTDDVRLVLDDSIRNFERAGATIVTVTIPKIEIANPMTTVIVISEAATLHREWLTTRRDEYGAQTYTRLLPGLMMPAAHYVEALNLRRPVLAAFNDAVFARADLLFAPTIPIPVPSYEEMGEVGSEAFMATIVALGHCSRPFNYLGLPTVSVPAGFADNGLPVGFQLAGRPFDEALVFRAARAYERETGCTDPAPDI
ncbi:MAG: amidase [Alphaproteobacteria bacterium]|nr:amidase [Alphaproteobacteria bacterium]MCZ6764346.1 amidase [Alphaproteobacteria bacterium]